jgi:hypothetical protein
MKKLFSFLAAATLFAACSSKSDLDTQKDVVLTDPSKMYQSNASTDVSPAQAPAVQAPPQIQTRTIIRERTIYVNRTPRAPKRIYREATPVAPVVNTVPQAQPNTGTATTQAPGTGTAPSAGVGTTGPVNSPVAQKKRGWSNAAKDATIGGVGGAVVGAVLSKNKGKGAVIGGILGAAGGYIFGRKKDKSNAADGANYAAY